jgi:DNA-binding CsgD family transcriptional regulator
MATPVALDLGRAAYAEHHWTDAFASFTDADTAGEITSLDLEHFSTTALLIGRYEEGVDLLTRAHEDFLSNGDVPAAARCAAWIGIHLMNWGDRARSAGWFARAQRLVQQDQEPDPTAGYLLIPEALGALYGGEPQRALPRFEEVAALGERFSDRDLAALGRLGQGQATIALGRTDDGLALLDEVMVAVTAGELSPIPAGIVYCAVIGECHLTFDVRRAHEWTTALDRWCEARPDMVLFSGQCEAHRAQLYCLHGAWEAALIAAQRSQDRARRGDRQALYGAWYEAGDVQRLRGDFTAAEKSYLQAQQSGFEAQPGLALLRLAQGNPSLAQAMIRRTIDAASLARRRQLLPALVEIELAAGDVDAARRGVDELIALRGSMSMPMIQAIADQAEGEVLLVEGDASGALARLRGAWAGWRELDAPYEAVRCRVLAGRACHALGDDDSALMEFEASRAELLELGAAPALAEVEALTRAVAIRSTGPLSPRELEVLRLVTAGKTNRSIASELYLSEKTVARHVSNILAKLDLPSRAAATAYAYEHHLVS